jgi:hypothetical protein
MCIKLNYSALHIGPASVTHYTIVNVNMCDLLYNKLGIHDSGHAGPLGDLLK